MHASVAGNPYFLRGSLGRFRDGDYHWITNLVLQVEDSGHRAFSWRQTHTETEGLKVCRD